MLCTQRCAMRRGPGSTKSRSMMSSPKVLSSRPETPECIQMHVRPISLEIWVKWVEAKTGIQSFPCFYHQDNNRTLEQLSSNCCHTQLCKNNIKNNENYQQHLDIFILQIPIYAGEWHRWIQIDPNAPVHARIQRGSSDKKMHMAQVGCYVHSIFLRSVVQYFL